MESGLSTQLVRLDVKTIINNYRDPKFWKQTWKIYEHDDFKIVFYIDSINVRKNRIVTKVAMPRDSKIDIKTKNNSNKRFYSLGWDWEAEIIEIPIEHEEYSQEIFEKQVLLKCIKLIAYAEQELIKQYSVYKEAVNLYDEAQDKLREEAEAFLDDEGVRNEDIRNAYIEKYIDEADVYDERKNVIDSMRYTVIPNEYLLCISYFNNQAIFDEYAKKTRKSRSKKLLFSILNKGKEIKRYNMTDLLGIEFKSIDEKD